MPDAVARRGASGAAREREYDSVHTVSGSVSAAEMFGAALSEVDQYELVDLATVPPIAVRGGAANDVVHVLSELLDNAISESEPDRGVSLTSSAGEPEWLIEITDSGPGLDEEALDRANARLVDPPEADVEATRRMGLHVVASLAQRHGLRVCLRSASSGGLTASVLVPAALVEPLPEDRKSVV